MALGAMLGSILSGLMRSRIGTRFTIAVFVVPITIGWAVIATAVNPAMVRRNFYAPRYLVIEEL